VSFLPVVLTLMLGQVSLLMAIGMLSGWAALRAGRDGRAGLDVAAPGDRDRLELRVDSQLSHDVLDMGPKRVRGDEQPIADLRCRETLGQGAEDLELARCQWLDHPPVIATFTRRGDAPGDIDDDRSRQEGLTGICRANGVDDVFCRPILREIAVCAGLDRLEDRLVVGQRGDHDDARGRPAGLDRTGGLGAGAVREAVVHQDHVEPFAGHQLGVGDGPGDPHHFHVRLAGEHRRERVGEKLVVLHEEDSNPFGFGGHAATPLRADGLFRGRGRRRGYQPGPRD